jgi:hypothetical protein
MTTAKTKKWIFARSVSYPSAWSQLRSRKLTKKRVQKTEEKVSDTGESYWVVEVQNKTEEKGSDTGESYWVVEVQNKTEEKKLGTDLLTEFV